MLLIKLINGLPSVMLDNSFVPNGSRLRFIIIDFFSGIRDSLIFIMKIFNHRNTVFILIDPYASMERVTEDPLLMSLWRVCLLLQNCLLNNKEITGILVVLKSCENNSSSIIVSLTLTLCWIVLMLHFSWFMYVYIYIYCVVNWLKFDSSAICIIY